MINGIIYTWLWACCLVTVIIILATAVFMLVDHFRQGRPED